jgi:uncharacterized protein (TIGR02246 family)
MTGRLAFVLLAAVAAPAAAQAPGQPAADERAVRALVDRYVDARERRDPAAIGALFTADADQFTTGGEWRRGREAVVRGALASSERTGGTRRITVRAVRFPAPDVAIADGAYDIAGTREGGTRQLWTTLVMTRGRDGWQIAAIRNAAPAAIPQ